MLSCLLLNIAQAATNYVTVPGIVGNGENQAPFLIHSNEMIRYQQIYDASQFCALHPSGAWITRLFFSPGLGPGFSGRVVDIQINLSTTSRLPDALSTNFSQNVGSDDQVVYDRSELFLSSTTHPGETDGFSVDVTLTRPFYYDSSRGNLLMDVRVYHGFSGAAFTRDLDAEYAAGDSVSRLFEIDVNAASGRTDTAGLLTRFEIILVPQPRLTMPAVTNGRFSARLLAQPMERYAIEATSNLTVWTSILTNVTSSQCFFDFSVPEVGPSSGFYRARRISSDVNGSPNNPAMLSPVPHEASIAEHERFTQCP